ncbi:hypothetical protein DBA20_20915 [Pandoraea capi]|nr:hypothetical protein [Pandoraea sp. LA3]MDN4585439.1 hypothetical protein [Pandoraea capi]
MVRGGGEVGEGRSEGGEGETGRERAREAPGVSATSHRDRRGDLTARERKLTVAALRSDRFPN